MRTDISLIDAMEGESWKRAMLDRAEELSSQIASVGEGDILNRSLFEATGDAIFFSRDVITDCNSRALELWGATREQFLGRRPWELSPERQPDGRKSRETVLEKAAQSPSSKPIRFEWQYRRFDGSVFDAEVILAPVRLSGVDHFLTQVREITERKQAERQILETNARLERRLAERVAQLEAANRELDAFAYSISHDLRAVTQGIAACSRIVMQDCGDRLDDAGRNWLKHIEADSNQLDRFTEALLDLSRVSRAELHWSEVDLSAMAYSIANRFGAAEPNRVVDFQIAKPLATFADRSLLARVMENLLSNAWKFTRTKQKARIEFGGLADKSRGQTYFVRDNGTGFDMKYAEKLFGAFQRLHRLEEFEGAGVGLAVVRRIIHRHGGEVWAEGKPNEGATVFFTVPAPASR